MSERTPNISKAKMSSYERELRSRLAQVVSSKGLVRATLNPREITCGKSACKCSRGEKHSYLYLIVSEAGKRRQLLIPKSLENKARQWVQDYQQAQALLEQISQLFWQKLADREE